MLLNFGNVNTSIQDMGNDNIGDTVLGTTVKEKDLGITISADTKTLEQSDIALQRVIKFLG